MFRTLSKLFRLKPYDNHLVDGMAELWLFLAAINIASIALCDAIAWAYFGYTTAQGIAAWLAAALAGAVVFALVGSLDAMFVMQDRARRARRDGRIHREHVALGARIVLVILTFTVTAPFLTQLFFARDIEANIRRRNEATIASRRGEIATAFDRRIASTQAQLLDRRRDLEKEIAGSGSSGRYGRGPTAATIERDVAALENQTASIERAREAELRAFDASVADPPALASRFGIDLVREGPATRARVIEELEQSPAFRSTQRTIKAFLIFMFLGLVCLKLFQPESVRIYYSARLQAAYARLKAGVFTHWLDPREAEAGAMTPVRFAEWYESDGHTRDLTDRLRDRTALAIERLKAQEEAVRVLQETLRADMARMTADLASAAGSADELEQQVAAAQHELDALNARISEEQQQVDDFSYDRVDELSLRDQQLLVAGRSRTMRQLETDRAAAARLTASLSRLRQRCDASRALEEQLRSALSIAAEESTALTKALHDARQQRLHDILAVQ